MCETAVRFPRQVHRGGASRRGNARRPSAARRAAQSDGGPLRDRGRADESQRHRWPVDDRSVTQAGLPVTATVGGLPAPVLYAGGAPGQVAGLFQLNLQLPVGLSPGSHAVVVRVGQAETQANVTVAVR